MKTIRDLDVRQKRVLVRCDFNVPLSERGDILDDFKIRQTIPTIIYLLENKAKIILMTHLGDPNGRVVEKLKLDRIAEKLSNILGLPVAKADDCVGSSVESQAGRLAEASVLLLENLRFHPEEERGEEVFAISLARLGEAYLNDAFAVCHRDHASLKAARFLPAGEGILLEKEITALSQLRDNPQKPLVVILGGQAKGIETKLELINEMGKTADFILLADLVADELKKRNLKTDFPEKVIVPVDSNQGLDLGPKTLQIFREKIALARTVFWSGPLGQIEKEGFSRGSRVIAEAIVSGPAFSVAGGGETSWFLNRLGLISRFGHVSTGGDALLFFLSGASLPGLVFLNE